MGPGLRAALSVGTGGADERLTAGILGAGRVGGPGGGGWGGVAGRVGYGVADRVGWGGPGGGGGGRGGPGGGGSGRMRALWGVGGCWPGGGGPVRMLAGRVGGRWYERSYSPKGCFYGGVKNALRKRVG